MKKINLENKKVPWIFHWYTKKLAMIAFSFILVFTIYNAIRFHSQVDIKTFAESIVLIIAASGGKSVLEKIVESRKSN